MTQIQRIAPCLWFDHQAEEAVQFYVSIFKNSKILDVFRYGEAGYEIHGQPAGQINFINFELDGQTFTAMNGGPFFKFNEAISLQVHCATQDEVDYYWEKLSEGGDKDAQQCGWLKDKYGVSWQVIPMELLELISDPESTRSQSVYARMLQMKKLDIVELRNLYDRACEMCEQEQKQEDGFLALLSAPRDALWKGKGSQPLRNLPHTVKKNC